MSSMNPMLPRAVPPPAPAFRLLSDLNEFLALPKDVREEALADYMNATSQRETALEEVEKLREAAASDRDAATAALSDADLVARATRDEAGLRSKEIIDIATQQAESVARTARESVRVAAEKVEAAEADAATRGSGLTEREEAVTAREVAAADRLQAAEKLQLEAQAIKDDYEQRARDLDAVISRRR